MCVCVCVCVCVYIYKIQPLFKRIRRKGSVKSCIGIHLLKEVYIYLGNVDSNIYIYQNLKKLSLPISFSSEVLSHAKLKQLQYFCLKVNTNTVFVLFIFKFMKTQTSQKHKFK